jgi:hypothetical protein
LGDVTAAPAEICEEVVWAYLFLFLVYRFSPLAGSWWLAAVRFSFLASWPMV